MDHETLQARVRACDRDFTTFVELWDATEDPRGTWLDPDKGVKLRMRLPPGAERVVLRTHIRTLTRRESLEVLATKSAARRLFARLYHLLWVRLPNEPRWKAAVFELDLKEARTLIAGQDDRITPIKPGAVNRKKRS
jgi:hypothetical protein